MQPAARLRALKTTLFILCLAPLAQLFWLGGTEGLGANPIEFVTHRLGTWTLNFLLITLAVTPLRHLTGWHGLLRLRRMLGLYAFFYALLHWLTYLWLDQYFDWAAIAHDITKRPFIMAGFAAFVLLLPLAASSNAAMIKRLGARRWSALHRLIYPIALLGVVHYAWLVKRDITPPLLYALLLGVLLAARVAHAGWQRWRPPARALLKKGPGRLRAVS